MKTFESILQNILEHRDDIKDTIIENLDSNFDGDLIRWKGMYEENKYIGEELWSIIKCHDCKEHLSPQDGRNMCYICGEDLTDL